MFSGSGAGSVRLDLAKGQLFPKWSRSGFGHDDDQEAVSVLRLDLVGQNPRPRWKIDFSIELAIEHF